MADIYIDVEANNGTLTGTLTFTNGSTAVTGSGTLFTTELAVGDYIKSTDATYGIEWYKVTGITDDLTLTIDHAFAQTTHSATAVKNSGDGSQLNPFCHLNQATTDTVRSPGDIIHCQLGQTHYYSTNINFDEDGTPDNPIKVVGDDWKGLGATSNVVLDFQNLRVYLNIYVDDWWEFSSIDCTHQGNTGDWHAPFYLTNAKSICRNCKIYENANYGFRATYNSWAYLYNVEFVDNTRTHVYSDDHGFFRVENCIFNGGTVNGTNYGIGAAFAIFKNCLFGQTSAHAIADIKFATATSKIFLINCKYNTVQFNATYPYQLNCLDGIFSEDHQQTLGAHFRQHYHGTATRNTTVVRTGGASDTIEVTVNSNCGLNYPFLLFEWEAEADAGVLTTVTVYIKSDVSGYVTFPTADQLWIEVEYYDDTSTPHKTIAKSTDVLTANDTWTAFTVSFTPAQTGKYTVRGWLAYYDSGAEASNTIYIDNDLYVS